MSPQIRADAARISPFPQTLVAQQGSSGASSIDSNDRARSSQAKAKKARGRPRQERNLRSDEDIKFNVGPLRKMIVGNGRRPPFRMGRQDRPYHDGINDDVPNYPPPSFQEAMSTASLSVCPSTTTLLGSTGDAAEREHNSVLVVPQPHLPDPPVDSHSESDSDESIEIIDKNTIPVSSADLPSGSKLVESIRKDWKSRRGVEFPSVLSLQVDGSRGRARNRSRELLPSELEDIEVPLHSPTTPKRRYMSLSPLRTFFPSRSLALQDKSLSAHPSPGSSPYSPSRSKTFFRSTTSIATTSILRLPLITTSTPTRRIDSSMSRKLFSSKGKEKARDSSDSDNLDAWELVDDTDKVVRAMDIMADPATPHSVGASPTRSQSFTFESPVSETVLIQAPIPASDRLSQETPYGPHSLSLRDKKVAELYTRPARRGPKDREPQPRRPEESTIATTTLGPIVTTVRTRRIEIPLSQRRTPSPLCAVPWEGDDKDEAKAAALFQQALNTPLPLSPISFSPDHSSASPTTPVGNYSLSTPSSPTTPVPERSRMSSPCGVLNDLPNPARLNHDNVELGSLLYQPTFLSQNASRPTLQEPLTPTRRYHYPGRPLPRPPALTRGAVDSTYASVSADHMEQPKPSDKQCPEGLLIDLDDTSLTNSSSGTSTPHTEDERLGSNSSLALATSLLDSPIVDLSTGPTPSSNSLSDMTDLDLLVSHLSDEQHSGSNYDALLLVSEFLGPANVPSQSNPLQTSPATNENVNISLIGRIELVRRRTTNDGRVKLRLSLLDIAVDRCGICLSQFRPEEAAGLTSTCHHAFHEKCLVKWLARNKTCPLCRIPLDVDI